MIDFDEQTPDTVEKAVDSFLVSVKKELESRNLPKAKELMEKARKRIEKLSGEQRVRLEERAQMMEINMQLIDLFPQRPCPFEKRFSIVSRELLSPIAFDCKFSTIKLLRQKAFCKGYSFPQGLEFDDLDANAVHALITYGDMPVCYARTWIGQKANSKWVVLDRMLTVKDIQIDKLHQTPMYNYCRRGFATEMMRQLMHLYVTNFREKLGLSILVVYVHARFNEVITLLLNKGFRFALSKEDVTRVKLGPNPANPVRPPMVFFDGVRIRNNCLHMFMPLPGAEQEQVEKDLENVRAMALEQIAMVEDEQNRKTSKELLSKVWTSCSIIRKSQQLKYNQEQALLQQQQTQNEQQPPTPPHQ